ncbi:DUF3108 domain-containing protein [Acetobacter sp. AN02]|uniref:DUF3108 domain-containing protein n=1 Tax=Acetobacter sp. AN02 TaxID=2894186 RepID=UPI00243463B5|nr:DUF3108 domain-containing protein [Acetobacter sp. AN02]MDG6095191.1 DUF3108 domain-containing protein [Acetobacter sp. AN02]
MSSLIRNTVLGSLVILAVPVAEAQEPQSVHLSYTLYSHWLEAAHEDIVMTMTDHDYSVTSQARAGGVVSLFMKLNVASSAKGIFRGNVAVPQIYESSGRSRGEDRRVTIRYTDGKPDYASVTPPENDREIVPEALRLEGTNVFSAFVQLLRQVRTTGRCDQTFSIFDGLRLSRFTFRTDGQGSVPEAPHDRTGIGLRCAFSGYQVAGFVKDSRHRQQLSEPHGGMVWFQDVPGAGMQAVRIEFDHPKTGRMTIILSKSSVEDGAVFGSP